MTITISGTTGIVAANIADGTVTTAKLSSATLQTLTPAGTIGYFAMVSAPSGWLICNGAEISRTTYDDLFTAIGTTYGVGDDSSTFDLPDLRGKFIRSFDAGAGVDPDRDSDGAISLSQNDAMQNITGNISVNIGSSAGIYGANQSSGSLYTSSNVANETAGFEVYPGSFAKTINIDASRQARTATEHRPKNMPALACIKY